jgi:hypothetical protein
MQHKSNAIVTQIVANKQKKCRKLLKANLKFLCVRQVRKRAKIDNVYE